MVFYSLFLCLLEGNVRGCSGSYITYLVYGKPSGLDGVASLA